jgi:hypothetical protein
VLYGTAAALLAAGTVWWWRADPIPPEDPRVPALRAAAERALPDAAGMKAGTVVVGPGREVRSMASTGDGTFRLNLACGGAGRLQVRLAMGNTVLENGLRAGSARTVACAPEPVPVAFTVEADGQAGLTAVLPADVTAPVVLRSTWTADQG